MSAKAQTSAGTNGATTRTQMTTPAASIVSNAASDSLSRDADSCGREARFGSGALGATTA